LTEPIVLYEDEFCLAVSKPNRMLVHHSHYSRNLQEEASLFEWLKNSLGIEVFPVHRLDYKTSGIVLLCKEKSFVNQFQDLFENQSIEKKYLALLRGHIDEKGIIDSPVQNERGNYKTAETHYQLLQHFTLDIEVEPYPSSRYSLVEFTPKTGRMHQLRIHANKISHPIIGDTKYGNRHHNRMFANELHFPNLFLHAQFLSFTHPILNTEICIEAQLPAFWNECLAQFEGLKLVN
jgi:tRNA pseudouridine65 synthase